jgi:hypothetical protein
MMEVMKNLDRDTVEKVAEAVGVGLLTTTLIKIMPKRFLYQNSFLT